MIKNLYCLAKYGKSYKEYIEYMTFSKTPFEKKSFIKELDNEIKIAIQEAKNERIAN